MMNKTDIFNKIGAIVNEIHEQHNYLSEHPDSTNDLELELFLANSKFLTGHIEVFQKLNKASAAENPAEQKPQPASVPAEPEIEAVKPEEIPPAPEQTNAGEEEESVTKFFLDVEPVEDEAEEEQPEAASSPEPEAEPIKEEAIDNQHIAQEKPVIHEVVIEEKTVELPQKEAGPEHVPTLNDVISAQFKTQATLAGQFTTQPVKDLKSIINLNDKLLFVKDLFNGYSLAYSEAIELLNRFDKFESADTFLKANYAIKNNWATKQSTVDHFYEILNRRFGR